MADSQDCVLLKNICVCIKYLLWVKKPWKFTRVSLPNLSSSCNFFINMVDVNNFSTFSKAYSSLLLLNSCPWQQHIACYNSMSVTGKHSLVPKTFSAASHTKWLSLQPYSFLLPVLHMKEAQAHIWTLNKLGETDTLIKSVFISKE